MSGIITNNESITTKLTLIIIGLTAASGLLIPATYASFHPVTSDEIGFGAINGNHIRDNSITIADLAPSAVGGSTSIEPGRGEILTRSQTEGSVGDSTADCKPGYFAVGGGYNAGGSVQVVQSRPYDGDTWYVQGVNEGNVYQVLYAYVLCMKIET